MTGLIHCLVIRPASSSSCALVRTSHLRKANIVRVRIAMSLRTRSYLRVRLILLVSAQSKVAVRAGTVVRHPRIRRRGAAAFLAELAGEEGEPAEVEYGEDDRPGDEGGVDAAGCLTTAEERPLVFVPCVDLVECEGEDEQTEDCVHVVLDRTATRAGCPGAGLDPVDYATEEALNEVEDEDGDTPFAVRVVEVARAAVGDG